MNNKSQLYKQQIIDHYKNPRNWGDPKSKMYSTEIVNYSCGDELNVGFDIKEGIVKDIKFSGSGCAISIASMSILSENIIGKKIVEIKKIKSEEVLGNLGMEKTSPRIKCGLLSLEAVRKLLSEISSQDNDLIGA